MSSNDKKFRIGIDVMLCTSAVLAVAIPTITYIALNTKTITKNSVPTELIFSKEMLDKFLKSDIQKFIDNNKSTSKEFSNILVDKLNGIKSVRITKSKPKNSKLKDGVFLKLIAQPECKLKFKDFNEINEEKHYINENQNSLWIWLYESYDSQPLRFFDSYTISNLEQAHIALNKEISKTSDKLLVDKFKENIDYFMNSFYSKLKMNGSTFKTDIVQSVYVIGEDVYIKLIGEYKKYQITNTQNIKFNDKDNILKIINLNLYLDKTIRFNYDLSNITQELISHKNNKWSVDDTKNNIQDIKQEIIKNTSGLTEEFIENISMNKKEEVELTLKNIPDWKYTLVGVGNNVKLEKRSSKTVLTISGLQYYANWGLSYEALTKLWNDVNQYSIDNHIIVAPDNMEYDTFEKQHKANIINMIKDATSVCGQKLGYFIGDTNINITRKFDSLIIKIDQTKLDNKRLETARDFKLEQGYMVQDFKTRTIELNHLAFSSPNEYFNISQNQNSSKKTYLLSDLGANAYEIMIPYGTKKIKSNICFNSNVKTECLIIPDSVTEMKDLNPLDEFGRWGAKYIKLSKSLIGATGINLFSHLELRKIDIYEGVKSFDTNGLSNTNLEYLVLPKSLETFSNNFLSSTWSLKSVITYANEFLESSLASNENFEILNLLSTSPINLKRNAFLLWNEKFDKFPKLHINVVSEENKRLILNELIDFPEDRITVNPNLEKDLGLK